MPVEDRDRGMDPPNSDVVGEAPGAGWEEEDGDETVAEDAFGKLSRLPVEWLLWARFPPMDSDLRMLDLSAVESLQETSRRQKEREEKGRFS